ncbi:ATP-binding protein, partial [Acinetobacter baumannii]
GNAVKFAGNGGRVAVGWTIVDAMVEIAIADDGPGIAPELLGRLGRPFESGQAERSDIAGTGGTGLGLAISHDLAQMQAGRLTIASTPGAGT